MTTPDKVIDKIRKLLAMAGSANENEAAVAMMKAQALLAEYNLTEADLGTSIDADGFITDSDFMSDSRPWRRQMATNLSRLYFCDYYYSFEKQFTLDRQCGYIRFDRHNFVGAPHNVLVCKSIFGYLCDTIDRLSKEEAARQYRHRTSKSGRASFITSFKHACAHRITERLVMKWEEIMDAPVAIDHHKSNLPALLKTNQEQLSDFIKKSGTELSTTTDRGKIHSLDGAIAGRDAGDDVGLDVQLSEKASTFMLEDKSK